MLAKRVTEERVLVVVVVIGVGGEREAMWGFVFSVNKRGKGGTFL